MLDKLKALLAKLNFFFGKVLSILGQAGSFVLANSKTLLVAIVGIFGVLEFNKIKDYVITKSGENEISKDNKENQNLDTDEKTDNQKADDLQNQANALPNEEKPVPDDWYKDK